MDNVIAYGISVLAGATVALLARPAWLLLSGLAGLIFADLPRVAGSWKATFVEPTDGEEPEEMEETIELRQLGRIVWGEGRVADTRERVFRFRGSLKRHTLSGSYHRIGNSSPSGTGSFQLQVSQNDERMTGWCIWLDADTNEVEASIYNWVTQK